MKKIMMVMLMCLMLVGCSNDYGIFTKEGYSLLTETEREEITESYNDMVSFIDCAKNDDFVGATGCFIDIKEDYSTNAMMVDVIMFNMQGYLLLEEYDATKSTAKYIIARDELSYYINDDSIEKISLTEDDIEVIKENLNKYY